MRNDSQHKHVILSKRLVLVNSMSSVITRFLNISVLVWMYQFLLNKTSTEEFSLYPVVTAIMGFAPLFFVLFTGGVSRYVVDAYAKGDRRRVSEIVSSMVPLLGIYSAVFLVLGLLFTWNIGSLLTIPNGMLDSARLMLSLLLFSFAAQMVALPLGVGFHVKQQFVLLNALSILRDVLRIALLFIFLLGIGASVIWVVVATAISEIAHLVLQVWWSRKLVPELTVSTSMFRWNTAKQLTSFGIWTTLGQLGTVMYTNAATIVLNKLGSALDVTNYHLGATLFNQIHNTVAAALLPLQPTLTAMNALGDFSRLGNTFLRGGRYALWASLIVACPLAIFSEELIRLYVGDRFLSASQVIFLFMLIFPFTRPTALLPMTAIATANVKPFYLAAFSAQFVGLGLMIYLAGQKAMGATGVTLALTIITVGSQVLFFWPLSWRVAKVSAGRFVKENLVPGFLPATVAGAIWFSMRHFVSPSNWLELLLSFLAGAVVYIVVLLVFSLTDTDRNDVRELMSRIHVRGQK